MKLTKFILLGIGLLALVASIYGLVKGDAFNTHLIGIICGVSLCFGYFELSKKESKSE